MLYVIGGFDFVVEINGWPSVSRYLLRLNKQRYDEVSFSSWGTMKISGLELVEVASVLEDFLLDIFLLTLLIKWITMDSILTEIAQGFSIGLTRYSW